MRISVCYNVEFLSYVAKETSPTVNIQSLLQKTILQILVLIAFFYMGIGTGVSQTTLDVDVAGECYHNIDGQEQDLYDENDVDITNCTSIQITVDYNFSFPFPGSGASMEYCSECIGGCGCDPNNPASGGCDNCWDFMWIEVEANSQYEDFLLGEDINTPQSGTYISPHICTEGTSAIDISITNQNWGGGEENCFENVAIICWEGIPEITTNNPICGGADLQLDGSALDEGVVDSWDWTSDGAGVIDDPSSQNTFATNTQDGEIYTLEATDDNGCLGTDSFVASVVNTFDATLTSPSGGDVIVCEGECADMDNWIEMELSGGAEPYTVTLQVNGIIPIPLPAINLDLIFIQICEGGINFVLDDPAELYLPEALFDITLEILSVTDANGCVGTVNGGGVDIMLQPKPDIDDPDVQEACIASGDLIDLTQYDSEIGSGLDVIWLETQDVTDLIGTPTAYDPDDGLTVYAAVEEDPCFSDIIPVTLEILPRPDITIIPFEPIPVCGPEVELPDMGDVASIENEVSPAYYLDMGLTDGPYFEEDILNLPEGINTIYVYDANGPNCDDISGFLYDVILEPEILSPSGTLSACGEIELPQPDINNEDDYEYNTEPDGTGTSYQDGDFISSTDGITLLYLIATNTNSSTLGVPITCTDTTQVRLSFLGGTSFIADIPEQICDTLFLPEITPISPSVAYYESVPGTIFYQPGDTITFANANAGTDVLDTLYLYDPNQMGACAAIDTLVFELSKTPILDVPFITQFCNEGLLPPPSNNNPNLEYATTPDFQPGTILNPITAITSSTQVYMRDSMAFANGGACYAYDDFFLEIIDTPDAGEDATLEICEGYTDSIDLWQVLLPERMDGDFTIEPAVQGIDFSDPAKFFPTTLITGTYSITYSLSNNPICTDEAVITIDIVEPPNIPIPTQPAIENCDLDAEYDLMAIAGFPDTGGSWILFEDSSMDIPDSTNIRIGDFIVDPDLSLATFVYEFDGSDDNPYCNAQAAIIRFSVVSEPDPGTPASIDICAGYPIPFDLFELLGFPDTDGTFSAVGNPPDLELTDPMNTDLSVLGPGNHEIVYTIEKTGCPIVSASINIQAVIPPTPGDAVNMNICAEDTTFDLADLFTDEDPGGIWTVLDENLNLISIPDPNNWDISSVSNGTYQVTYDVSESLPDLLCEGLLSTATLTISDGPNAGDNDMITICQGQAIDLNGLLSSDADGGGFFLQDDLPVTDPANWLPITFNSEVEISYILASSSTACPSDTAFVTVTISDELDAGTQATDIQVCEGSSIMLSDYIDGETPGGEFFIASDLTSPISATYDILTIAATPTEFAYILAGASGCEPDTSFFSLDIIEGLEAYFNVGQQNICTGSNECFELWFGSNLSGVAANITIEESDITPASSASFTVDITDATNGTLLYLCPGQTFNDISVTADTFFLGNHTEFNVIRGDYIDTNGICNPTPTSGTFTYNIREGFFTQIDTTVCPGAGVEIDGQMYFASFMTEENTIYECDSTFILNLDEATLVPEEITRALCMGQSFDEIPGFDFTDNIDTTIILTGQSAIGCDSTIMLELIFEDTATGIIEDDICSDDFIEVDGVRFDASMPVGDVPFAAGSVFGCDSITFVNLTVRPTPDLGNQVEQICRNGTYTLGDMTYDADNLTGTSLLEGASAFGCDSMVNVEVSIIDDIFDYPIDLCANQSIVIGGDTYSASNTMGTSTADELSSFGCDSILRVEVNIIPLGERTITRELCEDEDFVFAGETFNFSNPTGEVPIMNLSGCDSIYFVNIIEAGKDTTYLELDFCEDKDTMINGTIYNASNSMGEAMLTNIKGCDSLVVVDLFVGTTLATIISEICPDAPSGNLTITSSEGLSFPMTIEIPELGISEQINSIPYVLDVPEGSYSVTLDDGDCTYFQTVDVNAGLSPSINVISEDIGDNSFELSVNTGINVVSYDWQPADILDCNTCPEPSLTIDAPQTVQVTIESEAGCFYVSSILLSPEEIPTVEPDSTTRIFVPSILIGDNPQDGTFFIQSNHENQIIDLLTIYDRWGNQVFVNKDFLANQPGEGWDGRRDGFLEQGVYVYVIEFVDPELGPQLWHGNVTILR